MAESIHRNFFFVLLLAGFSVAGCGGTDGRYTRSGQVTFDGQLVPAGEIRFEPAAGNQGAGAVAVIQNGYFATPSGQGAAAGPHRVTIIGFNGSETSGWEADLYPHGKPLFENYQFELVLPPVASEHDIEVRQ